MQRSEMNAGRRTAVAEQQGGAAVATTGPMNKVDVELARAAVDGNARRKLQQRIVEPRLVCAPVETVSPVLGQTLDGAERRAGCPVVGEVGLVQKGGGGQLVVQAVESESSTAILKGLTERDIAAGTRAASTEHGREDVSFDEIRRGVGRKAQIDAPSSQVL